MSKYATLIAQIAANIRRNGAQAITGDLLQEQLLAMITSLGEYYQFGGIVSKDTEFTPGDEPVAFVAATPGTYTNFGGLVVADGEVALLVWSGSAWSKQTTDIATRSEVSQLGQQVIDNIAQLNKKIYTDDVTIGESVTLNSSLPNWNLDQNGDKTWVGASGAIHLYLVSAGQYYQVESDMQGNNPSMCLFRDTECTDLISIIHVGGGRAIVQFCPAFDCYLAYSYWDGLGEPESVNKISFDTLVTSEIKNEIIEYNDTPTLIQPTETYSGKFIDPVYTVLQNNEYFDVLVYPVSSYQGGYINIPYQYSKGASYLGYMFKDKNGVRIEYGNYVGKDVFKIPSEASTFWFSANANTADPRIEVFDIIPINEVVNKLRASSGGRYNGLFHGFASSLSANQQIDLSNVPDLCNNYILNFYASISSMGRIRLQHGNSGYSIGAIEVDDTNIYCYSNVDGTTLLKTVQHNVTISTFVFIQVEFKNSYPNLLVRISSDGGAFEEISIDNAYWNGGNGATFAKCISGTFNNANFSFGGNAWMRPTWIFVDSYGDYWPQFLVAIGMKNFLRDGFSGRNSAQALSSLKLELKIQTPKIILWCLGMNDGDGESSINQSYKNVIDEVVSLCQEKSIKLVITTIPNTPIVKNTYKNAYIKTLGVDYIDVAKAVGADEAGSSWTNGYLSGDNVHPTSEGARVIAQAIITGVPCLMDM